jgi:hypothetical protein
MKNNYLYFMICFNHNTTHYEYSFQPSDYLPDLSLKTEILKEVISYLQPFSSFTPSESIYDHPLKESEITPILEQFDLSITLGLCTAFEPNENVPRWNAIPIHTNIQGAFCMEVKDFIQEKKDYLAFLKEEIKGMENDNDYPDIEVFTEKEEKAFDLMTKKPDLSYEEAYSYFDDEDNDIDY